VLRLFFCVFVGLVFALNVQAYDETKLIASDGAVLDLFARSVDIDGDTAVVGAYAADNNGDSSGGAYVYTRSGSNWVETELSSSASPGDGFGFSVAIDGDTLAVGTLNGNAVYVYTRSGLDWSLQDTLTKTGGNFGVSVDIDGETLIVGCGEEDTDSDGDGDGAAYIYTRSGSTWGSEERLIAPSPSADNASNKFGYSVAIDNGTAVVGAYQYCYAGVTYTGAAWVYTGSGSNWTLQGDLADLAGSDLEQADFFGWSVDVDGDTVLVGAYRDGGSVSVGAAYAFVRTGSTWSMQDKIFASNAGSGGKYFGCSVSILGDRAFIGAYDDLIDGKSLGCVYEFTRNGSTWSEENSFRASDVAYDDTFGYSLAQCESYVIVSSYRDNNENGSTAGAAYIFDLGFVPKVFNEFQVNTFSGNQQLKPVVASNRQGEFVVVWQSKYTTDAELWYEISAQRYDQYGRKIGNEFIVNQTAIEGQDNPQIAMRDDGSFVVVWESYISSSNSTMEDIYGRLYDADCNPLTDEFLINTLRYSRQIDAGVGFNENGEFMVVWNSFHNAYDPVRYWEIRARIYNADGTPKTVDWAVTNDMDISTPQVISNGKGGYFLIYGKDNHHIYAAEYSGVGGFVSPDHLLAETSGGGTYRFDAHIDLLDNSVALVYGKQPKTNSEFLNVYAKKFDSNFNEIVSETILNDPNVFRCGAVSIDQFSNGDYVVTWTRKGDDDNKYDDSFARRFSSSFEPLEAQQAVNKVHSPRADSTFYISTCDVSVIGADQYIVAWAFNIGNDDMDIMAAVGPATYLGDFDFSGQVDIADLAMLAERWLSGEPVLDIAPDGGDGVVNLLDYSKLFEQGLYTWTSSADFDRSGKVDILDLAMLAQNWLSDEPVFDIAPDGGDGIVNLLDLAVFCGRWLD
jgi:hypothetical protein